MIDEHIEEHAVSIVRKESLFNCECTRPIDSIQSFMIQSWPMLSWVDFITRRTIQRKVSFLSELDLLELYNFIYHPAQEDFRNEGIDEKT